MPSPIDTSSDFWGVTTYYNLMSASRRRRNYDCFRRHLTVPLLTVEWHPDGAFQLGSGDADALIQISGGDLMWQKERLLQIGFGALPPHVRHVAWIDCDLVFERTSWVDAARTALENNAVIQLFSEVAFPDEKLSLDIVRARDITPELAALPCSPTRTSFLGALGRLGDDIVGCDLDMRAANRSTSNIMNRPAHGFAWAARREFLRDIGLYERCIAGAGDMLLCYGLAGLAGEFIARQRSMGWGFYGDCRSYRAWSQRAFETCRERIGCLDQGIFHLFHGDLRDRQYRARFDGLIPFALDLDTDIHADDGAPWLWKRNRAALNEYFLRYFRHRYEDGRDPSSEVRLAAGE
jgi:hypothetical protein